MNEHEQENNEQNFFQLPIELIQYILTFTNTIERMTLAQTCRTMKEIADSNEFWKRDFTRLCRIPIKTENYKDLFFKQGFWKISKSTTYFALGNQIKITELLTSEEDTNVVSRTRKFISNEEIMASFPVDSHEKVLVFRTIQDAGKYARSISDFEKSISAIFEVNIRSQFAKQLTKVIENDDMEMPGFYSYDSARFVRIFEISRSDILSIGKAKYAHEACIIQNIQTDAGNDNSPVKNNTRCSIT